MASAEEKAKKKEQAAADRELRMAGVIPKQPSFHLDSGRRVYTAWAWIPRLKWFIVFCSAVSILSLLSVLYTVYSRPLPRVFLSLPDGTIACGPLSDAKGNPVKRSRDYQALCDRLRPPVGLESAVAAPPSPEETPAVVESAPAAAVQAPPMEAVPVAPGVPPEAPVQEQPNPQVPVTQG